MSDMIDKHLTLVIINFIKHAIFTNAKVPLVLKADQSLDTSVVGVSFEFA
jgi:hypothetical protein